MNRVLLIPLCLTLIACSGANENTKNEGGVSAGLLPTSAPAKPTQSAVFDHNRPEHAKIACETCHVRAKANPAAVDSERPGHAACAGCHSSENYLDPASNQPFCATCHPRAQILTASLETRLNPFPRDLHQFGVKAFSHRDHLDMSKMTEHPADYGCATCHSGGAGVTMKTFPGHAECYSCHIHQAGEKYGKCEDCHARTDESISFNHSEGVAARDYHFLHSGHTKARDGKAIACETCHAPAAATGGSVAARVSDIARWEPARGLHHTSSCWGTCHVTTDEPRCGKCHVSGIPHVKS